LQSLRVAHQSKRFSRPDRNWIATSHPDGVFLPPRLFTFTIEYLLSMYLEAPRGYFHTSCEREIQWYFKLIEDRITQSELDASFPPCKLDVRQARVSGSFALEIILERVLHVGAHFDSTALAAGA
jgi:hypothetical protein|tara:strand:- start:1209 stop:1583 length:375 start_codon:yes stop_codon:yes gene_type:complete